VPRPIGVGIVGANPDRGWAARAHIPALASSPQFALTAVATSRQDSAEAARVRFGARHAFTDVHSLAAHPDVDLVVVTVKVPAHLELVTAGLTAGKHVYCEWPLARTADEASTLAAAARAGGVRTAVGLQARYAPAVRRAREVITGGRLGTVRSVAVHSCRGQGNALEVPAWTAYTYDGRNGAGLVEVLGGHVLDLVQYLVGPIRDLSARTAIRTTGHRIAETGEPVTVTAADHLLATAELDGGAVASLHLYDGEAARPHTAITVAGTGGNLLLASAPEASPSAAQPQIGRLDLYQSRPDRPEWTPVPVDADHASALPVEAANVARLYRRLAMDLQCGDLQRRSHTTPDFQDALDLHRVLERIPRPVSGLRTGPARSNP